MPSAVADTHAAAWYLLQWSLLPPDIEGTIAADAEEPRRQVIGDGVQVLQAEAEKGVLDHIASGFQVAPDPGREGDHPRLVLVDRRPDPLQTLRRVRHGPRRTPMPFVPRRIRPSPRNDDPECGFLG